MQNWNFGRTRPALKELKWNTYELIKSSVKNSFKKMRAGAGLVPPHHGY